MNQVLEAVTTLTSAEAFSMERLELLGDSVLKYVVSCSLYLKYPNKDEGQLSRQRQSIISNSNLHRLATDRKLQVYIHTYIHVSNVSFGKLKIYLLFFF